MKGALFPRSVSELRRWLEAHHDEAREPWIGLFKKEAGKETISYSQALDEVLSFGWIDGVRQSVDADSYRIRVTPRKPRSVWSKVNVARARELVKRGRMHPSGLAAFERRDKEAAKRPSREADRKLPRAFERTFKANEAAWEFFQAQAPYYRRIASFWVVSAKQEETRQRRLAALIDCSSHSKRIPPLGG